MSVVIGLWRRSQDVGGCQACNQYEDENGEVASHNVVKLYFGTRTSSREVRLCLRCFEDLKKQMLGEE